MVEDSNNESSLRLLEGVLTPVGQSLIEHVVHKTAEQAIATTLISLGFDMKNPTDVQKDVATMREVRTLLADPEYQKDMSHLREWRLAMGELRSKGLMVSAGFGALGLFALVVYGIKSKLGFLNL